MNLITLEELKNLASDHEKPCVSIYMPIIRAGDEIRQNPIRFKNLVRRAEEQLIGMGMRSSEAQAFLEPAFELQRHEIFWERQSDGLALFISRDTSHKYRLPLEFPELTVVTDFFHIKPLLQLFTANESFYVLALSQNSIRLLEGSKFSIDELDLEDVPQSLAEALQWDDPEAQLQFRTGDMPSTGGEQTGIFHGHGVGTDDQKTNILRYFHKINDGLHSLLAEENKPLILAGVEYLLPIYREANSYNYLEDEGITGNPENMEEKEIHSKAWAIVEKRFQQEHNQAAERYKQLSGTSQITAQIGEIVPAAYYGQVDHLFVNLETQVWGVFDPETRRIEFHEEARPGSRDLVDAAVAQTILNGGKVFTVTEADLPDGSAASAILRWPME
jgi:hypothetical protein